MEVRLRPELEELIKQDVQRGPYETVDEFVEQAVSMPMNGKPGWPQIALKSRPRLPRAMPPHGTAN